MLCFQDRYVGLLFSRIAMLCFQDWYFASSINMLRSVCCDRYVGMLFSRIGMLFSKICMLVCCFSGSVCCIQYWYVAIGMLFFPGSVCCVSRIDMLRPSVATDLSNFLSRYSREKSINFSRSKEIIHKIIFL